MRQFLIFIFLTISVSLYSYEWSKNNIMKFYSKHDKSKIEDYENINFEEYYFAATSISNSWMHTKNIAVGTNYVVSSLFVNIENHNNNDYAILMVRDSENDEILSKQVFYKTGSTKLKNMFQKKVYISLELIGTNIRVLSYGVKRIREVIIKLGEISIYPPVYFYGEGDLFIDFKLRFPAKLDIVIFDEQGTIIDYVSKKQLLKEGRYAFRWNPLTSSSTDMASGIYFVYFKALSIDGKKIEISKKFRFVNK